MRAPAGQGPEHPGEKGEWLGAGRDQDKESEALASGAKVETAPKNAVIKINSI